MVDENVRAAIQRCWHARRSRQRAVRGAQPKSSTRRPAALDGRGFWRTVARLWKATLERFAEQPEIKTIELPPHILRHARGDGLTKEGASVYAIRHYREHSSIATSQIEAGDERLIEEAASINLPAPRRLSRPGGD